MIIDIGTSTIDQITGIIADLFSDLLPIILLLMGLFLGFWIIETIINLVKREK